MRDSRPTIQRAFRMGDMVARTSGAHSGSNGRTCTRCGARLRRDKGITDAYCDPCLLVVRPWIMPDPDPTTCPSCGGYKKRGTTRCISCSNKHRTAA